MSRKNAAAVALGRRGGRVSSDAKTDAARANGVKGGRPEAPLTKPSLRAALAVSDWLKTQDGAELFANIGSIAWLTDLARLIQRAGRKPSRYERR